MTPAARIRPAPLGPGNASHNDFPRPRGKALGNGCSGVVLIGGRGDTGRIGDGDGRGAGRGFSLWPGLCAERAAYLGAMCIPHVVRQHNGREETTLSTLRVAILLFELVVCGASFCLTPVPLPCGVSLAPGDLCRPRHRRTRPGHGAKEPSRCIWIHKRPRQSCLLCCHISPASPA